MRRFNKIARSRLSRVPRILCRERTTGTRRSGCKKSSLSHRVLRSQRIRLRPLCAQDAPYLLRLSVSGTHNIHTSVSVDESQCARRIVSCHTLAHYIAQRHDIINNRGRTRTSMCSGNTNTNRTVPLSCIYKSIPPEHYSGEYVVQFLTRMCGCTFLYHPRAQRYINVNLPLLQPLIIVIRHMTHS